MNERRAQWLRASVLGALWLSVSTAVVVMPGCYGRNCEGKAEKYDIVTGGGYMLDANTWVSGPISGDWLPFPRQRTWVFDIPELGGRTPEHFTAYISANKNPSTSGDLTTASGNLAKFSFPRPGGINILNDSCSDYYLHLVLQTSELAPPVDASDPGKTGAAPVDPVVDAGDDNDGGDGG